MSDATFNYHVNEQKNDFANWIENVYGNKQLATELKKAKTREWARSILQKHMIEEKRKLFSSKENQEIIREKTQEALIRVTKEAVKKEEKSKTFELVKKAAVKKSEKKPIKNKKIKPIVKKKILKVKKINKKPKKIKIFAPKKVVKNIKIKKIKLRTKLASKINVPKFNSKQIPFEIYEPEPEKIRSFALEFGLGIIFGIIIGYVISKFLT